jgi:hypothetical protein
MFLVAVSLTAVLIAALPAFQELARAARSAEKLFDTLRREFPPTLEAIRLTGLEISELTDEINEGVKSASVVVKQVDQSLSSAKKQAQKLNVGTRSVVAGVKAAWQTFQSPPNTRQNLSPTEKVALEYQERAIADIKTEANLENMAESERNSPSSDKSSSE